MYRLCHSTEMVMYLGAVPDNIKDDNPEALSVYIIHDGNPNEFFTLLSTVYCLDKYLVYKLCCCH
jgi:hypothetical protein